MPRKMGMPAPERIGDTGQIDHPGLEGWTNLARIYDWSAYSGCTPCSGDSVCADWSRSAPAGAALLDHLVDTGKHPP